MMFFSASPCRFCLIAFAALVSAGTAMAQSEAERAEKWFRTLANEAAEGFRTDQFKMRFRIESDAKADEAEIASIRAKVDGLPRHPDRSRLIRLEDLRTYGPIRNEFSVWFRRGELRVNRNSASLDPLNNTYNDACVRGEVGWLLSPTTLSIVPTGTKSIPGHSAQMVVDSALAECKGFFGAGLGGFGAWGTETTFRMLDNLRWEASNPKQIGSERRVILVQGEWDPSKSIGLANYAEVQAAGIPAKVLLTIRCSEWIEFERHRVAKTIVAAETGVETLKYTLASIEPLSNEEFETITAIPAIDLDDPTRGQLTFGSISNHTETEPRYTIRDSVTGELKSLSYSETREGRAREWLRTAGWAIAAMISIVLLVLYTRRKSVT